jgi:hypothetical protein
MMTIHPSCPLLIQSNALNAYSPTTHCIPCPDHLQVSMLVSEYGYDAAFNYKTTPVKEGLAKHCPNGIDV